MKKCLKTSIKYNKLQVSGDNETKHLKVCSAVKRMAERQHKTRANVSASSSRYRVITAYQLTLINNQILKRGRGLSYLGTVNSRKWVGLLNVMIIMTYSVETKILTINNMVKM